MTERLSLIGFGEAGEAFANAAKWRESAAAFDLDAARNPAMASAGVVSAADAQSALADSPIALSLVTADHALAAAAIR